MEFAQTIADFLLHSNTYLHTLADMYGVWLYAILFAIIFAETGLIVTPILPGDSLLFAAGVLAGAGRIDLMILLTVCLIAAILGDTVNYMVGRYAGEHILTKYPRIIKPIYLERTEKFFAKHGDKTIILCRFIPIVRTFAPFVAGAGEMRYARFLRANIIGAFIWVGVAVLSGYFFGGLPWVQENFTLVLLIVVFVTALPPVLEALRIKIKNK